MSDMAELLTGIVLLLISVGMLLALRPRKGVAIWWIKKPFVGPFATILIVTGIAVGAIFVVSYFTAIDNMTLTGKVSFNVSPPNQLGNDTQIAAVNGCNAAI